MDSETDFNPAEVPPFPIFHISVETDGAATFNGEPVTVPEGTDAIDAVVEAAAKQADTLGLAAVRVTGVYDGTEHELVVTADGERYDTTPSQTPQQRSSTKRRRRLTLITIVGMIAVLAVVLVLVVVGATHSQQPTSPAHHGPPGAGQRVPIKLPNDYARRATWSIPVDDDAEATILNNGDVLTTAHKELQVRDPTTGKLKWAGSKPPESTTDVHETTWNGKRVFAATDGEKITLWPRYRDDRPTAPVSVQAPTNAAATYAGDTALADLGDYTVGVPGPGDRLARLTVPTGARPVINNDGKVTSIGDNVIIDTSVKTGRQAKPRPLDLPKKIRGQPQQAYGLDATHALGIWGQGQTARAVLIDTDTGKSLASATTDSTGETDDVVLDKRSHTALIGSLFVTTAPKPALAALDARGTPTLASSAVFSGDTQTASMWTWHKGKAQRKAWPRYNDDDPLPTARTDQALYVIAHQVDHDQLYRVGTRHIASPTPSTATKPKSGHKAKPIPGKLSHGSSKSSKKNAQRGNKK